MSKPAAPSAADVAVIASAIALPVEGGAPAKRFRIVPFGTFKGRDGRGPWHLRDQAHAERVIAATKAFLNGVDLLVNYDHQSEFSAVPGVGGQAKAAGWVSPDTLEVGADGIYASAEWTPPAEAALQAREYRYYSPHFRADKATGDLTRIVNVGLTNSPNIEVSALASQEADAFSAEGSSMNMIAKMLSATALSALGLTADSDDDAAVNAIDRMCTGKSGEGMVMASVRTKLKLADDADEAAILAAIDTAATPGEPDPAKFVPIAVVTDIQKQLGALQEDKVLACVDAAIEEGKLTPAQRDWALKLGKQDIGELNNFLASAPAFQGGVRIEGTPETRKTALTEDEAAICAMLGLKSEDYLKTRNAEEGNV
jgi:phage I-like protein